jgi:hypothetical protein
MQPSLAPSTSSAPSMSPSISAQPSSEPSQQPSVSMQPSGVVSIGIANDTSCIVICMCNRMSKFGEVRAVAVVFFELKGREGNHWN